MNEEQAAGASGAALPGASGAALPGGEGMVPFDEGGYVTSAVSMSAPWELFFSRPPDALTITERMVGEWLEANWEVAAMHWDPDGCEGEAPF